MAIETPLLLLGHPLVVVASNPQHRSRAPGRSQRVVDPEDGAYGFGSQVEPDERVDEKATSENAAERSGCLESGGYSFGGDFDQAPLSLSRRSVD